MTEAQRERIYFPTWRWAFGAAWMRTESGAIKPLDVGSGPHRSEWADAVMAHAATFAEAEVRGVMESDLRHAATALALQRVREWRSGRNASLPSTPEAASSKHLDGVGLDMFRALCGLIVDPLWLGNEKRPGLLWWEHPEAAESHRMLHVLDTRTTPGYAAQMCASIYGTRDYYTLEYQDLLHLYRLVRERGNAWRPAQRRGMSAGMPRRERVPA